MLFVDRVTTDVGITDVPIVVVNNVELRAVSTAPIKPPEFCPVCNDVNGAGGVVPIVPVTQILCARVSYQTA